MPKSSSCQDPYSTPTAAQIQH